MLKIKVSEDKLLRALMDNFNKKLQLCTHVELFSLCSQCIAQSVQLTGPLLRPEKQVMFLDEDTSIESIILPS